MSRMNLIIARAEARYEAGEVQDPELALWCIRAMRDEDAWTQAVAVGVFKTLIKPPARAA